MRSDRLEQEMEDVPEPVLSSDHLVVDNIGSTDSSSDTHKGMPYELYGEVGGCWFNSHFFRTITIAEPGVSWLFTSQKASVWREAKSLTDLLLWILCPSSMCVLPAFTIHITVNYHGLLPDIRRQKYVVVCGDFLQGYVDNKVYRVAELV